MDLRIFSAFRIKLSSTTALRLRTIDGPPKTSSQIFSNNSWSVSVKGWSLAFVDLFRQMLARFWSVQPSFNLSFFCRFKMKSIFHCLQSRNNVFVSVSTQQFFKRSHFFILPKLLQVKMVLNSSSWWFCYFQFSHSLICSDSTFQMFMNSVFSDSRWSQVDSSLKKVSQGGSLVFRTFLASSSQS